MNQNIEVINENLWLVNFHYIDQGYIPELKDVSRNHTDYKIITKEGTLILDKGYKEGSELVPIFSYVMNLDDKRLKENQAFKSFLAESNPKIANWDEKLMDTYIGYHHLEAALKMFNEISVLEQTRRKVKKEYKNSPKSFVRKLFNRKG
ncbi:hypothetical protein [Carnobacterium pleistocenium]|uniref:hypothetical protein n=1 Tax=Carnobacterium pleistocenium TaxID=181073 RepID=UPI00055336C1|nr:hypothetical protein [Carnobacterium pleistocenium]